MRAKYRNRKTVIDDQVFDSKREAWRWRELLILETAGEVFDLERQVPFVLIPKQKGERACSYIADFVYRESADGPIVVEDAKGFRTPEYRIKRKLMRWVHGIAIREV